MRVEDVETMEMAETIVEVTLMAGLNMDLGMAIGEGSQTVVVMDIPELIKWETMVAV